MDSALGNEWLDDRFSAGHIRPRGTPHYERFTRRLRHDRDPVPIAEPQLRTTACAQTSHNPSRLVAQSKLIRRETVAQRSDENATQSAVAPISGPSRFACDLVEDSGRQKANAYLVLISRSGKSQY